MYAARFCWVLLAVLSGQAGAYRRATTPDADVVGMPAGDGGLEEGSTKVPRRRVSDVKKMSEILTFGLGTITTTIKIFTKDPVDIEHGLSTCKVQFWELVLKIVPEKEHGTEMMRDAKEVWDEVFESAADITQDILDFRATGDTDKLMHAIQSLISTAFSGCSKAFPEEARYFTALEDLVGGVSESWDVFAEGNTTGAVELIWDALRAAVNEVVPQDSPLAKDETYALALGMIDDVISKLSQKVLEYKRAILNSKVCYKQTLPREHVRPSVCREGFVWDQGKLCIPEGTGNGASCLDLCGGRAGMCESFCGEGRACCRQGYAYDPVECEDAKGFVNDAFTAGTSWDYHQCVSLGPRVAFSVQGAGEPAVNGFYARSGTTRGRPRYTKLNARRPTIMEWSRSKEAWRLFVNDRYFGYAHSSVFYKSEENGATFPTSGWAIQDGAGPIPTLVPYSVDGGTSLYQASASEGASGGPVRHGTQEAMCDMGSEYNEKHDGWCLKPCPSGFQTKSATRCIQTCGGKFPAEGMNEIVCGTDQGELMVAMTEMVSMVASGAIESYVLIKEMQEAGVHAEKLSDTIDVLVEMGKPFARPSCPLDMASAPATPPSSD